MLCVWRERGGEGGGNVGVRGLSVRVVREGWCVCGVGSTKCDFASL